MRRRAFLAAPFAAFAQDQEREFGELMNDFVIAWNEVAICAMRHKWDIPTADRCEKAWQKMTSHPGWLRHR